MFSPSESIPHFLLTYTNKNRLEHDFVFHFFQLEGELKEQLEKRIPERYNEVGIQKAMDAIQENFECCGVNNISDWAGTRIPKSCCRPNATSCIAATFNSTIYRSEYFQGVSLKYDYKSSSTKVSFLLG